MIFLLGELRVIHPILYVMHSSELWIVHPIYVWVRATARAHTHDVFRIGWIVNPSSHVYTIHLYLLSRLQVIHPLFIFTIYFILDGLQVVHPMCIRYIFIRWIASYTPYVFIYDFNVWTISCSSIYMMHPCLGKLKVVCPI